MRKLIRNYLRSLKKDLLQILSLGVLVVIMVTSFLSLNFTNTYVKQQFLNDIAHNELHQDMRYSDDGEYQFVPLKQKVASPTWLSNLDYFTQFVNEKTKVNLNMLQNATFQLRRVEGTDSNKHNYIYRFFFSATAGDESTNHVHIGDTLQQATKKNYVDFTLSVPYNFLNSQEKRNQYLDSLAKKLDTFIYDPENTNDNNATNFFILNQMANDEYQNKVKSECPWATRTYSNEDLSNLVILYRTIIINLLSDQNQMFWYRWASYHDLLMTGKTIAFVQTAPQDEINRPVMINNGGFDLKQLPLKDNEIIVTPLFAKENHLKINQTYIFAGDSYKIRGFATSTLFASTSYFFGGIVDNKNQTAAFVNAATLERIEHNKTGLTNAEQSIMTYNPQKSNKLTNGINNYWLYQYLHQRYLTGLKNGNFTFAYNGNNVITNGIDTISLLNPLNGGTNRLRLFEWDSWGVLNQIKIIFTTIATAFLILIFFITTIIIFIIIYKIIDRNKRLVGILKASGYKSSQLGLPLVLSIIIPLFAFALLGACLAVLVSHFIIGSYSSLLILVNHGWGFKPLITLLTVCLPLLGLTIVSLIFVVYLLRIPALLLINNQLKPKKNDEYNGFIGYIFDQIIIRKIKFKNKLVLLTSIRGITKTIFVIFVSFFVSVLLLFSFASSGLINTMLGLQFAGVNYNYSADYLTNWDINHNFLNYKNQLLYHTETVTDIKSKPSLYLPLRTVIKQMIDKEKKNPVQFDFRNGYLMGSELNEINQNLILPHLDLLDHFIPGIKTFWHENRFYIDYLTNQNGTRHSDLMITFGLVPYDKQQENPIIKANANDIFSYNFNISHLDSNVKYNNQTGKIKGLSDKYLIQSKTLYGVNKQSEEFISPKLINSNFSNFVNLTLAQMQNSNYWLDQNFINTRSAILQKLQVANQQTANVQVIPIVTSATTGYFDNDPSLNHIGQTICYQYLGLDGETKYIIGVIYDKAKALVSQNVMLPEAWMRQILFGNYPELISQNYANAKFSQLSTNEFQNYFTILSTRNKYSLDLTKIATDGYLDSQGIKPAISNLLDVAAVKTILQSTQYTFQSLITIFSIFAVFLSFMIIVIISNINVRDNLGLISILKSLGFSNLEISYIFLIVTIPLIVIFGLLGLYLAPTFAGIVANGLASFTKQVFPVVFRWWYYAVTLLITIIIYFASYWITWKLNVSNKQLIDLTK